MDFILSNCIPKEGRMKCIVRVSHSTYKTLRGYSKRTDIRDLKVKSDLSMSDIFVDDSELDAAVKYAWLFIYSPSGPSGNGCQCVISSSI